MNTLYIALNNTEKYVAQNKGQSLIFSVFRIIIGI